MRAPKKCNKVLKALNQLKEQGGLDGYYGRLGDLGTIDDKFDVAISTAAGSALQHLVCDGEETAKRILAHLKEYSIGRASCVLLDQQEATFGHRCRQPAPKAPAGCTRLFDHVKPSSSKFAPVFYWALRETLVADNMDIATAAAFQGGQRHRVVTYAGEIIELSGTMSGGGNTVHKGAMKSVAVSPTLMEDLRQAQTELDKVSGDEKVLVGKMNELDMGVQDAQETIKHLEREAATSEKELKSERQKLQAADLIPTGAIELPRSGHSP